MNPDQQQSVVNNSVTDSAVQNSVVAQPVVTEAPKPEKDKRRHFLAAFFLSFMFGVFGVDRFYLGKFWTGLLKLITIGGFGIWALSDLSVIVSGKMCDKQGNELIDADRYKKFARNFMLILSLISITIVALIGLAGYMAVTYFISSGGLDNMLNTFTGGAIESQGIEFDQNQIQEFLNTILH